MNDDVINHFFSIGNMPIDETEKFKEDYERKKVQMLENFGFKYEKVNWFCFIIKGK
jgi:hypothetical protein